jgi:hypothetical protein
VAQSGDKGHGLPAPVRHLGPQALAPAAPNHEAVPCSS